MRFHGQLEDLSGPLFSTGPVSRGDQIPKGQVLGFVLAERIFRFIYCFHIELMVSVDIEAYASHRVFTPLAVASTKTTVMIMNLIVLIIVLALLFGGGGYYYGGPGYGGGGLVSILVLLLVLRLLGII